MTTRKAPSKPAAKPRSGSPGGKATPTRKTSQGETSASARPAPLKLDHADVGAMLRGARKSRGFTLQDLSHQSGIAVSTISKAERGEIALTYDKFASLAHALALDFDLLFGRTQPATPGPVKPSFTASGKQTFYETPLYDYGLLASDLAGKRMVPSRSFIKARSLTEFPDYIRHAGEEFVFVIAGALRLCFEDGKTFALKPGDSLYFDSGVGHAYLSTSKDDADVLVCCVMNDHADDHGRHGPI